MLTIDDPYELLAERRPFPADAPLGPEDEALRVALFERITGEAPAVAEAGARRAARTRRLALRRLRLPALAAVGAGAVALAVGLVLASRPSDDAFARVLAAGEATAALTSGRIVIEIDLREATGGQAARPERFTTRWAFSGDDASAVTSARLPGAEEGTYPDVELRFVDGALYSRAIGAPRWTRSDAYGEDSPAAVLGVQPDSADPAAMLGLLRTARDLREQASAGGATTYAGTIAAASIAALDPQVLPAGIALVGAGAALPPELGLTVVVERGRLASVVLDVVGTYPPRDGTAGGHIDATITTTYSALGEPVAIAAPPAGEVDAVDVKADAMVRTARVLTDYLAAHPGTCDDAFATVASAGPTQAELAAAVERVRACLAAEAGDEVAAAWLEVNRPLLDADG